MKPLDVDLDEIIEDMGIIGKYQIKYFLWTFIPVVLASLHATSYILTTDDVLYRCHIPECDDRVFDPSWLSNAIQQEEKCSRYSPIPGNSSETRAIWQESCSANLFDQNIEIGCTQYMFEDGNTFIQEMKIPCQDWKRSLVGTAHNIGSLIALPVTEMFSDKFGHRHCLIVSAILEGFIGIGKSLATNYAMFLSLEFLEALGGCGVYTSAYVLAMDLLTPSTKVFGNTLISTYFSIGQILLGFVAWSFPYWRTYLQVMYAPSIIVLTFYWISDESIGWLLSKRRYQEAMNSLKKIATVNGKTITDRVLESLQYNLDNSVKFEQGNSTTDEEISEKNISVWRRVLSSRNLVLRVLKIYVWWITCTFCFYGLSIMSTVLPGNSYVNFIFTSLAEIPSQIVSYYGLKYFERKKILFASFFGAGLCLFCFAFIPKGLETLSLIVYLFGKFFAVVAMNSVYIYTSEVFPTPLRHSVLGTCLMIDRIESIMAPQILLLVNYMEQLPSLLFASTCLMSAALVQGSLETFNIELSETVEESVVLRNNLSEEPQSYPQRSSCGSASICRPLSIRPCFANNSSPIILSDHNNDIN